MSLMRLAVLPARPSSLGRSRRPAQAAPAPGPLDPVIGVLPPVPVPHTPYDGPICADGDPQCIVDVIAEMEERLAPLAESATTTRSSRSPTCG